MYKTIVVVLIIAFASALLAADCQVEESMIGRIQKINQKACGIFVVKIQNKLKGNPGSVFVDSATVCSYTGGPPEAPSAIVFPCEQMTIGMPVAVQFVPGDEYLRARATSIQVMLQ